MSLEEFLTKELERLKDQDQYRELKTYSDDYLDFSSNDYLALRKNSDFVFSNLDSGSTASRLITGNSEQCEALEEKVAEWKGTEAALLFGSGYLANLGAISALAGPRDLIFSDELNHSCILDGIRLSGAKKFFYKHLDMAHLETLLEKHRADYQKAFVITDSIFSMQGTVADLESMCALKDKYDFALYLDEAHATGVLGASGAGLYASLVEAAKLEPGKVEIQMGTFSKACAVEGGYIAASKAVIDYLVNFARTFIYSTAPSPYTLAMIEQNLEALIAAEAGRDKLAMNINYLRQALVKLGLNFTNDEVPIFAILLDSNAQALELSEKLLEKNILVKAIRPPTVPQPCLRICLHADHSFEDIDALISVMRTFVIQPSLT